MRATPDIALVQFGAFSRGQAIASGWTDSALNHAVRRGHLIRLYRGAFCAPEWLAGDSRADRRRQFATWSAAATLLMPASAASHHSAAALHGLAMLRTPDRPCVTVLPGRAGAAPHQHLHRAELRQPGHLATDGAVARTGIARTVVDIAREHGIASAVVVADNALHLGLVSPDDLRQVIADCRTWPRIRRARAALALADGLAESALESVSRLNLGLMSLPRPMLQPDIFTAEGRWVARVDFLFPDEGVVGEADGADKYRGVDPAARSDNPLWDEKRRHEKLGNTGLIVERWGWEDLYPSADLKQRLERALERGRRRPSDERCWIARPKRQAG